MSGSSENFNKNISKVNENDRQPSSSSSGEQKYLRHITKVHKDEDAIPQSKGDQNVYYLSQLYKKHQSGEKSTKNETHTSLTEQVENPFTTGTDAKSIHQLQKDLYSSFGHEVPKPPQEESLQEWKEKQWKEIQKRTLSMTSLDDHDENRENPNFKSQDRMGTQDLIKDLSTSANKFHQPILPEALVDDPENIFSDIITNADKPTIAENQSNKQVLSSPQELSAASLHESPTSQEGHWTYENIKSFINNRKNYSTITTYEYIKTYMSGSTFTNEDYNKFLTTEVSSEYGGYSKRYNFLKGLRDYMNKIYDTEQITNLGDNISTNETRLTDENIRKFIQDFTNRDNKTADAYIQDYISNNNIIVTTEDYTKFQSTEMVSEYGGHSKRTQLLSKLKKYIK